MLSHVSNKLLENIQSLIDNSKIDKLKIKNMSSTQTTKRLLERLIKEFFLVQNLTSEYLIDIPKMRETINIRGSNGDKIDDLIQEFLYNNKYLNSSIYQFIKNSDYIVLRYYFNFGREYIINFYIYDNFSIRHLCKVYDKYVNHIMTMLFFLEKYRSKMCKTQKLEVIVFMTPFEKTLPESRSEILGGQHVNGGYTIPCQHHSKIFIWRKEEFFKVLIHESIHSMGIDISTMNLDKIHNNFMTLFPLNPDQSTFNIGEAYTEFWTEIINIIYYLVIYANSLKSHPSISSLIKKFDKLYFLENVWGLTRSILILKHMGLTYQDLVSRNPEKLLLYKERSNFFSYFIMKMVFMSNHDEFIEVCIKNNNDLMLVTNTIDNKKNEKILHHILLFIKQHYMNANLMGNYEILYDELIKSKYRSKTYNRLISSLRMSCIDYL